MPHFLASSSPETNPEGEDRRRFRIFSLYIITQRIGG
jgi:hypothetical protein